MDRKKIFPCVVKNKTKMFYKHEKKNIMFNEMYYILCVNVQQTHTVSVCGVNIYVFNATERVGVVLNGKRMIK